MTKAAHALPVLAVCLLMFALGATPAHAAAETFAGPQAGSASGQVDNPKGVAVDQSSGTVYVAEANNNRVSEFDSAGHFLRAFGFGVATGANELQTCTTVCTRGRVGSTPGELSRPGSVAVDQASHDVYVADWGNLRVEKYRLNPLTEEYEFLLTFGSRGTGAGQFSSEGPIALDASGNVWVGDVNRIEEFTKEGAYLSEVKLPVPGVVRSLAVDASGDFYAIIDLNSVQRITPPASGTYTLSSLAQTTAPLPFNATAAEVQSALRSSTLVDSFNVEGPPGGPYTAEVGVVGRPLGAFRITASAGSVTTIQEGGPADNVDKLDPTGTPLGTLDASGHPAALGLDPATSDLFVSDQVEPRLTENLGKATLLQFDSSGAQIEAFGSGEVIGGPEGNALAFGDTAARLYVVSNKSEENSAAQSFTVPPPGPLVEAKSTKATEVHKTAATLCAKVNPEGRETTYHFQYITETQFVQDGESFGAGTVSMPESVSIGADFAPHEVCKAIVAVPATSYRVRVLATNSNAPGGVDGETASFETLPPAAIDSTSAGNVTSSSAILEAEVNPLGDATSYRFEYLTEAEFQANGESWTGPDQPVSVPQPDVAIGAGVADVAVSQHVQGLAPHTVYRYRASAHNHCNPAVPVEVCAAAGPALSFTTQASGALALPDGRAWELVSPPDKQGAKLMPIGEAGVIQAAGGGDAIAYLASATTEAGAQGSSNQVQVLSTRGGVGASSWSARDIAPPHNIAAGVSAGFGQEYRFFSNDLSRGVLQPFGAFVAQLSPEASEQTPYLRTDFPSGEAGEPCTASCYRPLVTGAPGFANVPEGTAFGEEGRCPQQKLICGPVFLGAGPDLAHVVLASNVALTETSGDKGGLYEWGAGALVLVSQLPTAPSSQCGGAGPACAVAKLANIPQLGFENNVARNAISVDGSRVVWSWSDARSGNQHLYLRDTVRGETVQLDAVQGGPGAGQEAGPQFQTASSDGSRVFFTDSQQLTADSGAGNDLYECQIAVVEGKLHCALTDLSPLNAGAGAAVQGLVIGASAEGSSVYFVANGVLAANAGAQGSHASPGNCKFGGGEGTGACNLYLHHSGATIFIAVLSGKDAPDWGPGELGSLTASVSANGRWLAFMSQQSLTGYDNRDAVSGKRDEEVYLYDAEAQPGSQSLVCASCDPTGARPHGVEYEKLNNGLVGGGRVWLNSTWVAANVPGWTRYTGSSALYQSRYLSDSGRLFFNSSDALVPPDTNGAEDVYEYEPPKSEEAPVSDTCTTGSSTYSPRSGGCVGLVSSGTSAEESGFLDASENGDDVFFLTASGLAPSDLDTALDLYDAHVCAASSPCSPAREPPPPACQGDACQSPVIAPEDPTPGSLTFQGPGNILPAALKPAVKPRSLTRAQKLANALKACKKDKSKSKRAKCEKQARRAYGPVGKAKKSAKGRK